MRGTVKWFNAQKGWGFISDTEGNDVFVYHECIVMDGFRYLEENDVVNFELCVDDAGRKQAENVTPIVTTKMIKDALTEDGFEVRFSRPKRGAEKRYYVYDAKNNILQTSEEGMTFSELATYAEMPIEIAAIRC